jgi:glycerophosphoryl diester phosphodiesterase
LRYALAPALALSLPLLGVFAPVTAATPEADSDAGLSYGSRPAHLIAMLPEGDLKAKLQSCAAQPPRRSDFSIGHRGAPLMFPEHTVQSNQAAARMGAGILECDVTFTKDLELICRHAQNDLHTTTNILTTDLAETCIQPFTPATPDSPAKAECRSSDITLAQFQSLTPKMDSFDKTATSAAASQGGVAPWRSTQYEDGATAMTHAQSIALFKSLGTKFTPELKSPVVEMPFNGFTLQDYAQKLIDDYKAAGIPAADVWPQSFNLEVVKYWIDNEPEFGRQAVYLDGRNQGSAPLDPNAPDSFQPSMQDLADMGVNYIAPPLWFLLTMKDGKMVPSAYALEAKAAGLHLITWTLERSGPLNDGGGWYFQSVQPAVQNASSYYEVLDVLAQDVKIDGIFSDWPATVTYYANCMGL